MRREADGRGRRSRAEVPSSLSSNSTDGGSRFSWNSRIMQESRFFHPVRRLSPYLQHGRQPYLHL